MKLPAYLVLTTISMPLIRVLQGCPMGFTPAIDAVTGSTRNCVLQTDCEPGTTCRWTPYSSQMMCCRYSYNAQGSAIAPWYIAPPAATQAPYRPSSAQVGPTDSTGALQSPPIPRFTQPATNAPAVSTATFRPEIVTTVRATTIMPETIRTTPTVRAILSGKYMMVESTIVLRSSSVTLVQDSGYNIVIDTSATARQSELLAGLALCGLSPNSVHTVILTSGSPDHSGNLNLFLYAQTVYDKYLQKADQFMTFGLDNAPFVRFTSNTDLWKTPGPTPYSVTFIVRNVLNMGTIAITGDLFYSADGVANASIWQVNSWNITQQQQNRNMITCMADFIIPGHGRMFEVTTAMKIVAGCPASAITVIRQDYNAFSSQLRPAPTIHKRPQHVLMGGPPPRLPPYPSPVMVGKPKRTVYPMNSLDQRVSRSGHILGQKTYRGTSAQESNPAIGHPEPVLVGQTPKPQKRYVVQILPPRLQQKAPIKKKVIKQPSMYLNAAAYQPPSVMRINGRNFYRYNKVKTIAHS